MDYKTKPTCRRDLRRYSQILRKVFDVPLSGPFPVLDALEKIRDVFGNCNYEIVHFSPPYYTGQLPEALFFPFFPTTIKIT